MIGFALILVAILLPSLSHAETRAAFVVGNSEYENAITLANPARDARLVAATLEALELVVDLHTNLTRDGE